MRLAALLAVALVIGALAAVAAQGDRSAVGSAALVRAQPLVPPAVLAVEAQPAVPLPPPGRPGDRVLRATPRRYETPRCFRTSPAGDCSYPCSEFVADFRFLPAPLAAPSRKPPLCDRYPSSSSRLLFVHGR